MCDRTDRRGSERIRPAHPPHTRDSGRPSRDARASGFPRTQGSLWVRVAVPPRTRRPQKFASPPQDSHNADPHNTIMPLRAEGSGRSSLLAYGSKPSAATPLCSILPRFPRESRSLPPRDDLEIRLPRFPVIISSLNTAGSPASGSGIPSAPARRTA